MSGESSARQSTRSRRRTRVALHRACSIAARVAPIATSLRGTQALAQRRQQPHGRLFPPQDLGLLEAPDRDIWQRPDQIMDALAIAEASVVADVGAGSGWFTVRLARRVGPNGVVYARTCSRKR